MVIHGLERNLQIRLHLAKGFDESFLISFEQTKLFFYFISFRSRFQMIRQSNKKLSTNEQTSSQMFQYPFIVDCSFEFFS